MSATSSNPPQPFLKWVGGKRQLLPAIDAALPSDFSSRYETYLEPFLGGGSVLLHILSQHQPKNVVVGDMNQRLIQTYVTVRDELDALVAELDGLETAYKRLPGLNEKQGFYLEQRQRYNDFADSASPVEVSALFIFLNKTGFNGLYRVNKSGKFNTPFGKHENPTIASVSNLTAVSELIQDVTFYTGKYQDVEQYVAPRSFMYVDPPYRPLSSTSAFTHYTSAPFNDTHQIGLSSFLRRVHEEKGVDFMLSNSDPTNSDPEDLFFDELYDWARVERVKATRRINRDGAGRGKINEVLITSFS